MSKKVKFVDDIITPWKEIKFSYKGKNPFLVMSIARNVIRDTLKVSSSSMREDDIRWDLSSPGEKGFYGIWRGKRGEDQWTTTWIKLVAQGKMDDNGFGHVNVKLQGWLVSQFEYNSFTKPMYYFWNYLFYWKQRRAYLDFSRDNIMKIKQELLSALRIHNYGEELI